MELDFNELRELLTVLHQTDIAELTLKSSDFELTVRKELRGTDRVLTAAVTSPEVLSSPTLTIAPPSFSSISNGGNAPPVAPPQNDRFVDITAPMVGTFYRSPSPDDAPYVEVGDQIRSGQTVCIIEAMKLMNDLEAEVSGEVVEILVQNGEPVEYGQPLMRVNPG